MNELTKRVLMALWGIPLILGLSYLGGFYFLALLLVINGMALWEFFTMYRNKQVFGYRENSVILSSVLLFLAFWFPVELLVMFFLLVAVSLLLRHLLQTEGNASVNTAFSLGGVVYITVFLISLLQIRLNFANWTASGEDFAGGKFLVLLWLSIWICDTLAYFGGKMLGRHKMAPRTSPNKTVEGGISGLAGAVLVFAGIGPLLLPVMPGYFFWISGLLVGIFGQLGDLVESRFKRDAGVKDTSTLLPGHGGFLDRFDSMIFVSPVFYIFFQMMRF